MTEEEEQEYEEEAEQEQPKRKRKTPVDETIDEALGQDAIDFWSN